MLVAIKFIYLIFFQFEIIIWICISSTKYSIMRLKKYEHALHENMPKFEQENQKINVSQLWNFFLQSSLKKISIDNIFSNLTKNALKFCQVGKKA